MLDNQIKDIVRQAIQEETKEIQELKNELKEIRELLETERISVKEAKQILNIQDDRTLKKHLDYAGISPVYDEAGRTKFIRKQIVDYAHNKDIRNNFG